LARELDGPCHPTEVARVPSVRIFQPAKNAMQSGRAKTRSWIVEFEPGAAVRPSPLMGWSGGGDTRCQVRLAFDSQDDAVAFARKHGLNYEVQQSRDRSVRPRAYSDNFRAGRQGNWTH
jgi:hypothetical protein